MFSSKSRKLYLKGDSRAIAKRKWRTTIIALIVILGIVIIASIALGRYSLSLGDIGKVLATKIFNLNIDLEPVQETIVFNLRLRRIIAAMLVGSGIAVSGAAFQGVFRNPLVSPDILGVSSGAGFGAALGIILSGNLAVIQILAFSMGILAVLLSWGIGKSVRGDPILGLVLSGIAIGSLFTAFISLMKYTADPYEKLPTIIFWLMGSLNKIMSNTLLFTIGGLILAGIIMLLAIRWKINVLALGDEEAKSLGVNTTRLRMIIIIGCTIVTAAAVSISGIIGWVGLVVPHMGRMLVGPSHDKLLPVCVLLGAIFLIVVDDICRCAIAAELPLSIVTAIVGVPFFLYLIRKRRKSWA
jgi:iron complex transport system permease protein